VRSTILAAVVALGLLAIGSPCADAAFRLTFRNGTSVEVSAFEDLGDVIRYPRFGGTVTVLRADIVAIEEASHFPAPTSPAPLSRPASNLPAGPFPLRPSVNVVPASAPAERLPTPNKPPQLHIDPWLFVRPVFGTLIPFMLVLLAIAALAYAVRRFTSRSGGQDDLPYQKAERLLTPAERTFYDALRKAIDGRWSILAKVRLGDLLEVPYGTMNRRLYRNKIDRKHVDFVLCAAHDFAPLLVIELDDSSHDRWDAQRRDAVKDAALRAAGLPLLRVDVAGTYAPAELRERIDGRLSRPAVEHEWAAVEL
jgi:Protein of unknown function (DUF2726)